MKKYCIEIDEINKIDLFPHKRLKNKIQLLEILLSATRYILANQERLKYKGQKTRLYLVIDKMSRLIFVKKKKIYSIYFPFFVEETKSGLLINYKNNIEITPILITQVLSIIKSKEFTFECVLTFAELFLVEETDCDHLWNFTRELLMMEDGYIRYDNDPEQFNKALKNDRAKYHPLDHLDIFYSNGNTFKIGLNKELSDKKFQDIINVNTECKFIN